MAQKRLSWINLPFGSTPKSSSDVNGWGKHDVKLFAAVKKGDTDKVKSILKKGTIDPTKIEPNEGISSLHAAAANGKLDILNLFLTSEINIETTDLTGKTALHHAADKGKADVTKRLLRAGANVSAVDHDRLSALHHACSSGMIGCLLELLAMPNSPVNARDKDGKSPLSYAAWKGQASLCKLLLEKGAQINSRDNSGCTPLILAGMNGSAELCSFLLAQGADLSLTDIHGHNALWHCTNSKRGTHLHAARVIQEAMMDNSGGPSGRDAPVRAHSEREVTERTTSNVHYEATEDNEEPKENLYEGINEQEEPDYSDEDAPSSASTAAATSASAGPWQGALYGNEARPHIMRTDTYLMRSDDNQRRSPDEAIYSDINFVEQSTDVYDGLETMEAGEGQEKLQPKTDDLLEGWRDRLKGFEDESRSESEADESDVKDPNQLLITFAQKTTGLGAGGSSSSLAAEAPPPPLSPADTFFNNLMATIAQRDRPPMSQDSKDLLLPFNPETPAAEKGFSSDGSQSEDELPFDTIYRENMPSLNGSSVTKNDTYQLVQQRQQLEHKFHSQIEDLERKMSDANESNNALTQQLELSKDQTMQANKDCDSVKQRLEAAIGIKTWLHNELQALYNSIETTEKKLMQTEKQESHTDKSDDFDILSDLEGYKQHIDYMLETSNVEGHHSVDVDASAQKTSLKMMEIRLDRLMKENAELRTKIKEEQQRKTDDRYDDFEKRMAHEYQKLDEEIEFRDADEMIAYIKDSITEISRLREQNTTMSTRLQSLEDLGITDQHSLFSELERTQALNRNLMDKIMILQRSIEEQSETIKDKGQSFSEQESFGEVAVQRDIFVKEYDNLKLLLEKKMAEGHVSQEELRELDEMRNKQKELLLIVARMEETGQQKEIELQLKKKQIADFEKQLEDYGLIASERDLLRRDLYALSTMKAELDVNSAELNELRRINLDLSETKKELLESIDRRDAVCDEKEKQIVDLNRRLQEFGQLVTEKSTILREQRSLRSDVDEHPAVVVSTAVECYGVPSEALTESGSGREFGQIKLKVEKLKEDLDNKNEELERAKERNNELNKLILEHKSAEDDKLKKIEELSQKVREFELLLDIKKEEQKTELRIAEAEHLKALEMLSHKNKVLIHDLEEARERAGSVEKLKAGIHMYDDTLRQKSKEVEQLSEKITMQQREALKRSAIDDDNDRIRDEHRMMAREILELKLALESSKDREIGVVKTVNSDLLMTPLFPTTDAMEEIGKLTAENARLQERVADLERAFLKRISTNSSIEHENRPDKLNKSDVDGRKHQFQIMDVKDLEKSWKDLEDLPTTGPIVAASQGNDTVDLENPGLKSHVDAPFEAWNGVLAENRTLKVTVVNAQKKMEAELVDAELRNVALKENNRDLQQEIRSLRKTIDELMRHNPLSSDAEPQKESSYFELSMMAVRTAEDTLEKWKEVERLDKENSELRKEIGDRRNHDRVIEYQPPFDEVQIRKISELMTANSNLIATNNILQSEVKELKTAVEHFMNERTVEDNDHSASEESDEEKQFKPKAVAMSYQRSENLYNGKELENYGKLAVERDILLNEVNALKKLMNNQTGAEQCNRNLENNNWYQPNENEHSIAEMRVAMSNYGKLANEKDILKNEVQKLKTIIDGITSSRSQEGTRQEKRGDDSDNEQRRNEDYRKLAIERDILANEVKNLKTLLDERNASGQTVTQIHQEMVQTKKRNEGSDDSDEDEHKRANDIGKIAVERDVLISENKALKKLLEELQSTERPVKHITSSVSKAEKSDDDSDNVQRRIDDYGKLAVERDILANEVKNLKKLLDEMKASERTVTEIHQEMVQTKQRNERSDDSDEDEHKRSNDTGKIAVERDVLISENKALKKLLEELQSTERPVKHITSSVSKAEKSDDDSDNEQRRIDDYGKLAVENDILANEVKNLKQLLDEMKASERTVTHVHQEMVHTRKRNDDSDDSDDDEHKRANDIGKIAVERDVLISENKALKTLLEELQSSERPVKHITSSVSKAEQSDDDSDNEQRRIDDYGRLAVERDILANEVKNLKKLLDERNDSEQSVTQIHQEMVKTKKRNENSDDSDDDEHKRANDIGKMAVERDVLISENKALKKLLEESQSTERPVKHITSSVSKAEKSDHDSDNEQRRIDDYGKLAIENDILANEVKNLKQLLDERNASGQTVTQIHQEMVQTKTRNEGYDDSEDEDEHKRANDIGKIAVERDVLISENKALKTLLEELQSSERPVKHITSSVSKAEKSDDDSDNEQRRIDDYGRVTVERDILANEVKNLKKLLDEMKASERTVTRVHQEMVHTRKRNDDSDDSDDDEHKRANDIGKIAVERDVLISENKALKKLLEESQSTERPVKHITSSVSKAEKSDDDSDNEQRPINDYGRLAVERDILANEVKNLKKLLDERNDSEQSVTQIHQEMVKTKKRNENSDDSDEDEHKRASDIGKMAVERDVLISENKALKKLLEELQSTERPVKHITSSVSKAEKSDDDSDNEQRRIDDYGKLAIENDILANEVKNLKMLLDDRNASGQTVTQIHQEMVQTKTRNEGYDDSEDEDEHKRANDIGKIAVERDVLISENKALKTLLEELQSSERPVKHITSSVSKAEKSDDDSDNEQRRIDDYGRLAVERDILANEVKNLKKLLDERNDSEQSVTQIHQEMVKTKKRNENSDDDEHKRASDIGKMAVERDVLISENKALKKLLEESQSTERPVKHITSSVSKAEKSDDDSDNEQRRIDDYGRLTVERDILANEVKNLKKLLDEMKASERTVTHVHQEMVHTRKRNDDSDDSDDDEHKRANDFGKIAVERDVLISENKALKTLLEESQSSERPVKHITSSVSKPEKSDDDSDNEQRRIDDYGRLAVERDILANEVKNLKKLLDARNASGQSVIQNNQEMVQTKKRNENSDDSDDDEHKRTNDIGKMAVERDVLISENKALKKLLEDLQSSERSVKHITSSVSKAEKTDDDSDNEQRRIDNYGRVAVERDILANEVKNLKKLLDEMKASERTVTEIHQEMVRTKQRNERSDDSDEDEHKRASDIGKIAVERDVLISENKALKKLLEELQSTERPVKHITSSVSKAEKSDDDSDNEQRRIDDYGRLAVERDILANEVKNLKMLLDERNVSGQTVTQIHQEIVQTKKRNEGSDDSEDVDEHKRANDIGKIAVERDVLISENKALKKLLEELQSSEGPVNHATSSVSKAEKSDDDSDNEQRRIDDYGRLAVERDILANEVKNLKQLLDERNVSGQTVTQIHQEMVQTKKRNEGSDYSDEDEHKRANDCGKIAVERDVLISENKALKKLLEESQSTERPVKHITSSANMAEKSDDDSDNEQRRIDDYGRLAVERDILANEVKNLKKLLDERNDSGQSVTHVHQEMIQTRKRNDDSDDSDDEHKRTIDIGKMAVERDMLISENIALKKLLEELQSTERPVKHITSSVSQAEKSDDDSDNEQRRIDDYGKLAVERDILANEVKNLKMLLDERNASGQSVIQIHQEMVQTKTRNENSDDSDDDEHKRANDIGKIAVERDVLISENKALKKLLEDLQSTEGPVNHATSSVSKAEKSDADSDNEQRRIDDYGKLAVERDILANEVKNLKKLLDEMKASERTVTHVHQEMVHTRKRNDDSDDSDDDEHKRANDIGKIAVERDVLISENKALKKLLEESQSTERPVKHITSSVSKAEKSDDDSDNEQRRIDDYGRLAVERDILANEVKNLKKLLDARNASGQSVIQNNQEMVQTKKRNENSDDSDDDEHKRTNDIGKMAVERDVLISENKALKKLLEDLQSSERSVKHITSSVSKAEKSDDDSDNEQRRIDDYGRLTVERDILANEVKNLKKLLDEMKASERTVTHVHQEMVHTRKRNDDSDDSDDDEHKRANDIGNIAVERDVLISENKALKKLLEESQSTERPVKHITSSVSKAEKSDDDSDNEQRRIDDYGRLAVERDILANEVKNLKMLLDERNVSGQTVTQIHQEMVQTKKRNEGSDDSEDVDEHKRANDIGKIAVERDVLISENKALKKLLEELQSSEGPVNHATSSVSKAEKSDDDSDNEQRRIDDYGRLAVERDILANEVKNLKQLLDERNVSGQTVTQIHQEMVQTKKRNEGSDYSDEDEHKRANDFGKIAVERDVLISENKALKKLLEESQSTERPVKHITSSANMAEKSDDDSDNEQRRIDDYGRLAVERDILANEVKNLKKLLDERNDSGQSVTHVHQEMIQTRKRNDDSDDSDDEHKRTIDIGKMAVERDMLISENIALKKLLEELQSTERPVKHITSSVSQAEKSDDDSDNEQRRIDDYGKLAVERDILANEVKNLKMLLDERNASGQSVIQIHQEMVQTKKRNENSDDSDDDEHKRANDIGKIAVERDVLISENKALKKLLEDLQSTEGPVNHATSSVSKAVKSDADSDNEQRRIDDYGKLAVERDILANEVKNLKKLLDEMKASERTVTHVHQEMVHTRKRNDDSDDSDDDEHKRANDIGKIAVERDVLISENKALKKLLEELQSTERPVKHITSSVSKAEKSDDDSDNEQRRIDDYGRLAVERDILANEVKNLKQLLDEMKASERTVTQIHHEMVQTRKRHEGSHDSDEDEHKRANDIGKIAVERDVLISENKALKKLLEELQSTERSVKHITSSVNKTERSVDDSDNEQSRIDDYGRLAAERDVLANDNKALKNLLLELQSSNKAAEVRVLTKGILEVDEDLNDGINHESNVKNLFKGSVNYGVYGMANEDNDGLSKDRELEELKKRVESLGKVTTERDNLRVELAALKLVLDNSVTQPLLNTASKSKRGSLPNLETAPLSEKLQEPADLRRRVLEVEEANHRLERSVSEIKEIAEKQSSIIQKKEKLIRSFHDKEKIMSDMEKQLDELKDTNLKLSRRVTEQEEIAEKQSDIIKKKEKRISEINIFAHEYDKLSVEKDALCKEVKDLKHLLQNQKGINPEISHSESNLGKTVATNEPSPGLKYVAENDTKALMTELEKVKRNREELLAEISTLEETLQEHDQTIMELKEKEQKYETIVNTLRRDLDIARDKLSTEHGSSDLVDISRRDENILRCQPDDTADSPVNSDDEESQVALNALRRKIAEKEKMIKRMDSEDEEKQFLEEEVEELREKLKRQESTIDNIRIPVGSEDDFGVEMKKLRQDLTDREREIERLRVAGQDEHRELQNQMERLKQEVNGRPSHLTAEYEASLLATIFDLEQKKAKLQDELRQNLEEREHEIKEIRNAEVEERRELYNQIERLKQEVNEHPSHLPTDYEGGLLTKIADLEGQNKKLQSELRQNLEDREHEIERIRNAEVEERRVLQIQIERLNKEMSEYQSNLTADHEADLLTKIANLERQKKKLQSTMDEKEAQCQQEIKELAAENDEFMSKLTKVKKEAQKQYAELMEENEGLLENNGLLQKQCAELADEQEELVERDRLLQIEVKNLKEELQAAENKWLKDKAKLDDDNKVLSEQLEQQKLSSTKEIVDLQNRIASLLENFNPATKEKENTVILTKQIREFESTADNQAGEIFRRDKEIADLTIKKEQHFEVLAERDILSEKVERLEDLLRKRDEPSERVEQQMTLVVGRPMPDARPPENIPDLREIVEMQEQTLAKYEKKLNEQTKQIEDLGKLSVENDVLQRELNILRDFAGEGRNKKDYTLVEIQQHSAATSDVPEVDSLKFNVEHLTKQNKELRKKIEEFELSVLEEKEKSDRKILELKWSLTKSEDESKHRDTENKELREKLEDLEQTVSNRSSTVESQGFGDAQVSQNKENDRLESEILELRLKLTRSEERSQRNLPSDERHTHLETLVQHLESDNAKLKLRVSQLEAELELSENKPEAKEKIIASQLQQNQQQQKARSSHTSEYDVGYVRQLEGDMELLREVNRALSKDIADIQYRLAEKLVLMRSDGISDADSDRDYLHKKMKDFTQQSLRYLAEIQDLEEKNRRERQEIKTLRQENDELRDEVDTLQEIYHLHYTSPKDLVNRMRLENNKLQQFIKILEQRLFKKVSAGSETEIDVKSVSVESFGLLTKPGDDPASEEGSSLSSSQRLLFAGTLDECHQEIQRLRQINKDLERKYKEIVSTYRSHLLASIQGRLDPEVKEALIRILQMKPVEYDVR